jgi:hypothetical protein
VLDRERPVGPALHLLGGVVAGLDHLELFGELGRVGEELARAHQQRVGLRDVVERQVQVGDLVDQRRVLAALLRGAREQRERRVDALAPQLQHRREEQHHRVRAVRLHVRVQERLRSGEVSEQERREHLRDLLLARAHAQLRGLPGEAPPVLRALVLDQRGRQVEVAQRVLRVDRQRLPVLARCRLEVAQRHLQVARPEQQVRGPRAGGRRPLQQRLGAGEVQEVDLQHAGQRERRAVVRLARERLARQAIRVEHPVVEEQVVAAPDVRRSGLPRAAGPLERHAGGARRPGGKQGGGGQRQDRSRGADACASHRGTRRPPPCGRGVPERRAPCPTR